MDDEKRIEIALGIITGFENGLYQAETPQAIIDKIKTALTPEPTSTFQFLYFKESGKWGYEGYGVLPKSAFTYRKAKEFHSLVLQYNNGRWPGITNINHDYAVVVVTPDEDHKRFDPDGFGFHLLYTAGSFSSQ